MNLAKLKYLIPTALLIVTPWVHFAIFKSAVIAGTGMDEASTHVATWLLQAVATFGTIIWMTI